jgi:predicted nucleic acid-binding protein
MELIIDANILMAALIATEGMTYDLIYNDRLRLFAPEFLLEECEKYQTDIMEKSGLSHNDFTLFLSLITARIEFIAKEEFNQFIQQATEITPDPKDTEYIALALKMNCAVWSNDKNLKNQEEVKVYNTKEILEKI